jgi:ABC-type multidrug transport system fused ATPase/permease subunit
LFIAGISIILFYSPWFFLCIFVFLSFIFLINFLFSQRIRKEWNRYFEFFSIKEGVISENILGFIFIKLNNLYNIVKSIFEKTLHRLVDKEFKTNLMINLFSNILLLISFTGIIVIYGVLGILFAKGRISIGEGITVSVILFMLINSFSNISNNYISLQSSISAGLRIKELLEGPQEIVEDRINIQNLSIKKIVFKNVKFRYPGNENFILELDKEFLCGRTYALVGKSGSGKTSLMKLMCGLYSPQEGKILVNTYDLKALSLSQWRDKIGFMHQDPFILKDSVLNNIKLSKWDAGEKEIMKAAIEANLEEYIKSLPEGINTILGERGITISGGEKQRIELARIFLKNPEIVILDEPTAHLDVITEQSIKKALSQWKNDKTIFIITHKFFFIEFVDEVILLENGKVVDIGSHSSLLERNSLYREMLFLSTGGSDTIKKT